MKSRAGWLPMIALAAGAAVFTTICDAVHVLTGTLSYSDPFWLGQSWSVFPSFTAVFVLMMFLYDRAFTSIKGVEHKKSTSHGTFREMTESFLIFFLVYLMSGFGSEYPVLLNVIFYGSFLWRWSSTYERSFILIFSIVLGLGGMLGEGLLVELGWVEYTEPDIFHVPWWLGGVYLHGGLALREMMRYFIYTNAESS